MCDSRGYSSIEKKSLNLLRNSGVLDRRVKQNVSCVSRPAAFTQMLILNGGAERGPVLLLHLPTHTMQESLSRLV